MLSEFENKVLNFIKANGLFEPAGKVLLAVSGGADSMGLLHCLAGLKARGLLKNELICAHINHHLRGRDADLDEEFVTSEVARLKLALVTGSIDVRQAAEQDKLSIETAARKLRIEALLEAARENGCRFIATAHQMSDNAETVLDRLARGTGFRGLGGIWPMRKFPDEVSFVRPLLSVDREQVVEYLRSRRLGWREDLTNTDCRYRRNFIRHRLIPELQKQCTGPIEEILFCLSDSARSYYTQLCDLADELWEQLANCTDGKAVLKLEIFSNQPIPVRVELIRRSLAHIGCGERNLTDGHYKRILQLAKDNISGKSVVLPGGFTTQREYGWLIFERPKEKAGPWQRPDDNEGITVPGQSSFNDYLIEADVFEADLQGPEQFKDSKSQFVECFDLDKLKLPLEVRFRRPADRFWPLGLPAQKRIGKFLTAQRVPRQLRRQIVIIADTEKIIWVWPIRICEPARITPQTKKILQLRINKAV
jgi:tRNA(Ile)-lysidine synthase